MVATPGCGQRRISKPGRLHIDNGEMNSANCGTVYDLQFALCNLPEGFTRYDYFVTFVSSIRIILYCSPLLGSAPNISITFLPGPAVVSICFIVIGLSCSGQLQVKVQVSVLPSFDNSPSP